MNVGSSATQNITLTNSGNAALTISAATASGTGFSVSGLTLPVSVNPGSTATLTAKFAPTSAGSASGSISFTDNAAGSPQVLTLAGTGVATTSTLGANPSSVAFGSVVVGTNSSQTITLTNSGNASVTISQASVSGTGFSMSGMSSPMTLTAGQSTSLSAVFNPAAAGSASGTITVSSNASDPTLTIALSGTGTQGQLSASPASVNFGSVVTGASASVPVTVTNSGTASVTISAASASGTGFGMSGLTVPQTLGPNASASFTAKFAPTSAGNASGSVSITSNAPGSPLTIALSGSATAAQPQLTISPTSVSFGNVNVGSSATQNITLTNSGNAALTISAATASGTGFSASGLTFPVSVNPGSSATLTAKLAPMSAGSASGSISITSDAPGSPATIPLSGTGIQGQLSASPMSISFGNVLVGSSGSQNITLTNSGTAAVTVSAASAFGTGFSISGIATPLTINAGQNTTFAATFAPTSAGAASGSVSITSNAPGSPLTITMSGTGTQAQLSATPSSVSFGNVVTGNTNSQTITLKNSGSASVTISQVGVSGIGFSISGLATPTTIAAGGSTSFSAAFAPTSAGSVSGSVSLVNSGPNSPLGIPLSGTGVAATQLLGVSPTTLSFGNVNDGTSTSQSVTLTNNGNSNVTISSIGVTGAGFSGSGVNSGLMLSPNQTATLTITFDPSSGGPVTGTVTIASNATNSPATVSVSGTGIQPHSVLLTWTASTSSDVVSYNVYRGTSPGSYSKIASVSGTTYTDTTVQSGQNITYYYAVTAVDSSGDESTYSNQATATVP